MRRPTGDTPWRKKKEEGGGGEGHGHIKGDLKGKSGARSSLPLLRPCPIVITISFCSFLFLFFFLSNRASSFPSSLPPEKASPPCSPDAYAPAGVFDDRFCTGGCSSPGECFPRVRGICFSSSRVKICEENDGFHQSDSGEIENGIKRVHIPAFMRFCGERVTLPVVRSACSNNQVWNQSWTKGLSIVADQRFLPYHKPNPHHEAEKLIPALLLLERLGYNSSVSIYWFSLRRDLSAWAKGFLQAVGILEKLVFIDLPKEEDHSEICFEDAILFSAPTNLWYIPDQSTNQRLRERILRHCSIPLANASWPPSQAAILDRLGSSRNLANKVEVEQVISQALNISVMQRFSGVGTFCNQVKAVADLDFLLVPHGSQNVNLIFARPGSIVIEVFPYLYHTIALQNYTHAAELCLFHLLGTLPQESLTMHIFSFLGWDACFKHRLCKNLARRQRIHVNIHELEKLMNAITTKKT